MTSNGCLHQRSGAFLTGLIHLYPCIQEKLGNLFITGPMESSKTIIVLGVDVGPGLEKIPVVVCD